MDFKFEYELLKKCYIELKEEFDSLEQAYDKLDEDYNELDDNFLRLKNLYEYHKRKQEEAENELYLSKKKNTFEDIKYGLESVLKNNDLKKQIEELKQENRLLEDKVLSLTSEINKIQDDSQNNNIGTYFGYDLEEIPDFILNNSKIVCPSLYWKSLKEQDKKAIIHKFVVTKRKEERIIRNKAEAEAKAKAEKELRDKIKTSPEFYKTFTKEEAIQFILKHNVMFRKMGVCKSVRNYHNITDSDIENYLKTLVK